MYPSALDLDILRIQLLRPWFLQKPTADILNALTGSESFFKDDAYLQPVIAEDPLLGKRLTWALMPCGDY